MSRTKLLILLLVVFSLMSAWLIYSTSTYWSNHYRVGQVPQEVAQSLAVQDIPLSVMRPPAIRPNDQIRYGGATSVISVIEFGNFDCQYCRALAKRVENLLPGYRGRVRFIWRDFLIREKHPRSLPAAIFARCAGEQGKFWEAYDLLMASGLSDSDMRGIARNLKLNEKQLGECRKNPAVATAIARDIQDAREIGIKDTPLIFIGTQAFDSAPDDASFEKAVNNAMTSL